MVTLMRTDGTVQEIEAKDGINFENIRKLIGCEFIEIVSLDRDKCLAIDENGKLIDKEINTNATHVFICYTGNMYDYIVGDAVFCNKAEIR